MTRSDVWALFAAHALQSEIMQASPLFPLNEEDEDDSGVTLMRGGKMTPEEEAIEAKFRVEVAKTSALIADSLLLEFDKRFPGPESSVASGFPDPFCSFCTGYHGLNKGCPNVEAAAAKQFPPLLQIQPGQFVQLPLRAIVKVDGVIVKHEGLSYLTLSPGQTVEILIP